MRARFPKQARLTEARDFEAVYRSGQRVSVFPLRARVLRRRADASAGSRLGLAVGKQVGGAALRHDWKRAVREAFRLHRDKLPAAYDIVIGVEWGCSEADVSRVEQAFLAIVEALREDERPGPASPPMG